MAKASWSIYDEYVCEYQDVIEPAKYDLPARHLANLVSLKDRERVLDVGTGTGVVAKYLQAADADHITVFGAEPAIGMASAAARKYDIRVVTASTPGLPFEDQSFDAVTAGFVLSHVEDYELALRDIARILKAGGRFCTSAWGKPGLLSQHWAKAINNLVDGESLAKLTHEVVPFEEFFEDTKNLVNAAHSAGFIVETANEETFEYVKSLDEYLDLRESLVSTRILRRALAEKNWQSIRQKLRHSFEKNFGCSLSVDYNVNFLLGRKPGEDTDGEGHL